MVVSYPGSAGNGTLVLWRSSQAFNWRAISSASVFIYLRVVEEKKMYDREQKMRITVIYSLTTGTYSGKRC